MDAFGNLRGLATDLKESFEGLIFEADITGFVHGLGYNSLLKVASSISHGFGSLTFHEQHELMRKRMMRVEVLHYPFFVMVLKGLLFKKYYHII